MVIKMEFNILYAIQNIRSDFLDSLMKFISSLGNGGLIWILTGILMLFFKNYRKCGYTILLALIFCLILGNGILKNLIARDRPCWIHNEFPLIIGTPKDYSFPSGHTFSSFAASVSILFFHKKIGIFAVSLASVIAFSRLYLFVHFPTDILGGILLGTMTALISKKIILYLCNKKS
jgi:undecaprenyl-diphosphatase